MSTDHFNKTIEDYAQSIATLERDRDGWKKAYNIVSAERVELEARVRALEEWKNIHQGEVTSLNNEIERLIQDASETE